MDNIGSKKKKLIDGSDIFPPIILEEEPTYVLEGFDKDGVESIIIDEYIKIQNKLIGYESRPILDTIDINPGAGKYIIKNIGQFEADNIILTGFGLNTSKK